MLHAVLSDLTPVIFFFDDFVVDVFTLLLLPVDTEEELTNRNVEAAATIRTRHDAIQNAKEGCLYRAECCIHRNGGHFK